MALAFEKCQIQTNIKGDLTKEAEVKKSEIIVKMTPLRPLWNSCWSLGLQPLLDLCFFQGVWTEGCALGGLNLFGTCKVLGLCHSWSLEIWWSFPAGSTVGLQGQLKDFAMHVRAKTRRNPVFQKIFILIVAGKKWLRDLRAVNSFKCCSGYTPEGMGHKFPSASPLNSECLNNFGNSSESF